MSTTSIPNEATGSQWGPGEGAQTPARVPLAPIGGQGDMGECYPEGVLQGKLAADVSLVSRALNNPRWPIRDGLRAKCIDWLQDVVEKSTDDRVVGRAIQTLAMLDKLNLEVARLSLMEEQMISKRPVASDACGGVTIILEGNSDMDSEERPSFGPRQTIQSGE